MISLAEDRIDCWYVFVDMIMNFEVQLETEFLEQASD
jgi:hypothetical protein